MSIAFYPIEPNWEDDPDGEYYCQINSKGYVWTKELRNASIERMRVKGYEIREFPGQNLIIARKPNRNRRDDTDG